MDNGRLWVLQDNGVPSRKDFKGLWVVGCEVVR